MKSGTLTKPSGSLYDDEQLFWMSLGILGRGGTSIIGAFLFGNLSSSRSPFDVGSPPSVLMRFQGYWGWFRSRKPGLISGILRGKCFVLWNGFVKSNIVGQRSRMES